MEIRKGFMAVAALAGLIALTGCTQQAEQMPTSEPTATPDPFYVDVQVPYVTQKPEPTVEVDMSGEGSYIAISSEGRVTVLKDGWDELETASTDGYYTQLREGDTGTDVEKLQARLAELGYYTGEVNGTFDATTRSALMLFEGRYSEQVYGIATVKLQKMLYHEKAAPANGEVAPISVDDGNAVAYAELRFGDQSDAVIALQQRLLDLGYFGGDVNGIYDYFTACAVMRFEAAYKRELTGVATISMQEYVFADKAVVMNSKSDKSDDGWFIPMKKGDEGADVLLMQQRLVELGYADAVPNGEYNTFTVKLVKQFQENCELKDTGKADKETLARLYAVDAPRAVLENPDEDDE